MKLHPFLSFGLLLAAFSVSALSAQTADLQEAHRLSVQARYEEAKQIYKSWLNQHPDDAEVCFSYGYALYLQACAEEDATKATALRKEAYVWTKKAQKLGNTEALISLLLDKIDADGNERPTTYSSNAKANTFMAQGEQAFAKHDLDQALQCYQDALAVDHLNYQAALYSGDVYFSKKDYGKAIEWFSKAVGVNPEIETAYRYWGDALLHQDHLQEARDKYIEAVIAEPYNRMPREMLQRFAGIAHMTLKHPEVKLPMTKIESKDGKTEIGFDPESGPLVLAYTVARAKWRDDDSSHYFPKDWSPRHSLPEEAAGLRAFCQIFDEIAPKDPASTKPWEATVASLKSLDKAGLLEAYILLDRADAGIARDYAAYRLEHRDLLIRYAREIWFDAK